MATKKQKRQAAMEQHEAYMEECRQSGLAAQRKDRDRRERNQKHAARARLAELEQNEKSKSPAQQSGLNAMFSHMRATAGTPAAVNIIEERK